MANKKTFVRWKTVAATVAIVTYLSAFGFSVYDRDPISDWLTRHLPMAGLK